MSQPHQTADITQAVIGRLAEDADPRFNKEVDKQSGFRTRTILALPVKDRRGGVFAVAQLLNRRDGRPFDAEDERKFSRFMESIGTILENLESLENERVSREG